MELLKLLFLSFGFCIVALLLVAFGRFTERCQRAERDEALSRVRPVRGTPKDFQSSNSPAKDADPRRADLVKPDKPDCDS